MTKLGLYWFRYWIRDLHITDRVLADHESQRLALSTGALR